MTPFVQYLRDWLWAQRPPRSVAWLAAQAKIAPTTIWGWIHEGRIPNPSTLLALARGTGMPLRTLYELCGFEYPEEFAAPALPSPHPARGGQIRTPEQDILDDIEAVRRNPRYSPQTKAALIELMERALQGYSVRQELLDSEHVVEGISGTFVTVPKEPQEDAVDEQPTKKLDALPRPSQRQSTEGDKTEMTQPRRPPRPGTGGTQHERSGAGTGTAAKARPHRAPRSSATIKDR